MEPIVGLAAGAPWSHVARRRKREHRRLSGGSRAPLARPGARWSSFEIITICFIESNAGESHEIAREEYNHLRGRKLMVKSEAKRANCS